MIAVAGYFDRHSKAGMDWSDRNRCFLTGPSSGCAHLALLAAESMGSNCDWRQGSHNTTYRRSEGVSEAEVGPRISRNDRNISRDPTAQPALRVEIPSYRPGGIWAD